jgi:hypothetical protein
MGFSVPSDDEDPIKQLVEELEKDFDKLGVYLRSASVTQQLPDGQLAPIEFETVDDLTAQVRAGVDVKMVVALQIGDLAFSKRLEQPDVHETDVQASEILPPEHQLLKDNAEAAAAEGVDPIDALFETIEDENPDDGLAGV